MKVLIRADSGNHIGLGHVMRCLTLAHGLMKRNHEVYFITRKHEGYYKISEETGINVLYLESKGPLELQHKNNYCKWAGISSKQDVLEVNSITSDIDLAIIDHYSFDYEYEQQINARKIFVIDDLMNRRHYCDYLLDQNLSANLDRYQELSLKSSTQFFMGPKYALLREEFSEHRPVRPKQVTEVNNILVSFGAGDVTSECRKIVDAYVSSKQQLNLHIVLNSNHRDFECIKNDNIKWYDHITNMSEMMSKMDVCFGACGSTSWERASLSLPSFVVTVADNQKQVGKSLESSGAAKYLGSGFKTTQESWGSVFSLLSNNNFLNDQSQNAFNLCDGKGVTRIIDDIFGLSYRHAQLSDMSLLFKWANDKVVRSNSFNSKPIVYDGHCQWFNNKIKEKDTQMLIFYNSFANIGQVRIEKSDEKHYIGISIDEKWRNAKFGKDMLLSSTQEYFDKFKVPKIYAEIKHSNTASIRTFEKAGFVKYSSQQDKLVFVLMKDN